MLPATRVAMTVMPRWARPQHFHRQLSSSALSGFTVTSRTRIEEFNLDLVQCVHGPTGAQLAHVETMDTNKTFAVVFRTPPTNDTGVPHILGGFLSNLAFFVEMRL